MKGLEERLWEEEGGYDDDNIGTEDGDNVDDGSGEEDKDDGEGIGDGDDEDNDLANRLDAENNLREKFNPLGRT